MLKSCRADLMTLFKCQNSYEKFISESDVYISPPETVTVKVSFTLLVA